VGDAQAKSCEHQQGHQAFPKAFPKALPKIGGIITQVTNSDLSMRVQKQALEMDSEIATFKRTINTMKDQLEVFWSEVSRVAREVGTGEISAPSRSS
jgi:osomolarity two-component system, sensor histidine kinase NIK1